jgi:hypothetical protein
MFTRFAARWRYVGRDARQSPWWRYPAWFPLCVVLIASAHAGPPFRTDDPEPVPLGHFEINLFSQATLTNSGWSGELPASEINFGAATGLQLHAAFFQGFATEDRGIGFAPGDVELGAKYRFIAPAEGDWFPQVAIYPTIELPAGNQKLGFGTGHVRVFLPLWLQKDFDPWSLYGGGGYWINPGFGNRDYAFLGIALWRKMSDHLNLGVEFFHQTSPADGIPDSTGFNFGLTYDLSDTWHFLASTGRGLADAPSTNGFSYYVALQLTI